MMAALLSVSDLCVQYPDTDERTLPGVSFEVKTGEIVLLVGPSGSGKSTLAISLNGAAGQVLGAEVSGTVLVDGANTLDHPVAQNAASIAVVTQDADAQIVTGNVWDEVCFGPENLGLSVEEVERRAAHALTRVGLLAKKDDAPATLSGGERQRLVIASAISLQPKVLVLDEPTANLDGPSQAEVYALLQEVAAAGTAV